MVTEIGRHFRLYRIKTGDSLRAMAVKLGISAAYLSAIENGKRNVPTDLLETFFIAYSLEKEEKNRVSQLVLQSVNNYRVDLTNLSDKQRQVLLSISKEELDDSTIDKLAEILSDNSTNKTEKL